MADKKISELTALVGALNVADALPIADDSSSQTKKINPKNLLEQGFLLIDDGSIPSSKLAGTSDIPGGSIGTDQLAGDSVTDEKLADQSTFILSDIEPTAEYVGQGWVNTTNDKTYIWNGASWLAFEAAGSINALEYDNSNGVVTIAGAQGDDTVTLSVEMSDTTGARQFIAGPTSGAGAVSARPIIGTDLPEATTTERGAVSVPADSGLSVTSGAISIDNTVTPNGTDSVHLTVYDAHGLVTGGRSIASGDLPHADLGAPGAVSPGTGLAVSADGELNHVNNISPGQGTKVSWDAQGHVTGANPLLPEDLPTIPGSNIGSGLDGAVIDDRSIAEIKLADYSTCLVQEGQPSGDFKLGQFWFTPSTNQLRVYTRGSAGDRWESIGFGALQQQNLRWAGTCNADTSTITTLTDIGVSEGLEAGEALPTPTDELSGLYFVVETAGSGIGIPNVNNEACTEGDWILYINQAQGALHLDIAAGGGGGGGGASKLNDLSDVALTTPEDQQLLVFESKSGKWINGSVIDGGDF